MLCVDITSTFAPLGIGAKARMARNLMAEWLWLRATAGAKLTSESRHREQRGTHMNNLYEPDGVTEKDLETYSAGLRENAKKGVRTLLDSGAGEADVAEYMASLEPEAEDAIGPPEGPPPHRPPEGPPPHRPEKKPHPAGVQSANTGYWQGRGVTRAGAKRSKRP